MGGRHGHDHASANGRYLRIGECLVEGTKADVVRQAASPLSRG
jgi:hypothetical protein